MGPQLYQIAMTHEMKCVFRHGYSRTGTLWDLVQSRIHQGPFSWGSSRHLVPRSTLHAPRNKSEASCEFRVIPIDWILYTALYADEVYRTVHVVTDETCAAARAETIRPEGSELNEEREELGIQLTSCCRLSTVRMKLRRWLTLSDV